MKATARYGLATRFHQRVVARTEEDNRSEIGPHHSVREGVAPALSVSVIHDDYRVSMDRPNGRRKVGR